jgi:hypothetical protein
LFNDFINAANNIQNYHKKFLIIGQRWDMDVSKEIGENPSEFSNYRSQIIDKAKLHPPMGSDYCIFPRSCFSSIPDFAIGRAGWDNWFIYKSRWEGWTVIDATEDVMVVHQSHDYSHLPGGKPHYRLPETKRNVILGGGEHTIFTLHDAQFYLQKGKLIKKRLSWERIIREIEIFPLSNRRSKFFGKLLFYVFHPRKGYRAIRKAGKLRR